MEYSIQDVERKFYRSVLRWKEHRPSGSKIISAYCTNINNEDGLCKIELYTGMPTTLHRYVPTEEYPDVPSPYVEPVYENFPSGLYWTYTNGIVLVRRLPKKAFTVGIHTEAYSIKAYDGHGVLGSGMPASAIDLNKPRVFSSPDIFSPKFFKVSNRIHYNGMIIGVCAENNIYLDDEDFKLFLPESVHSCIVNP